MAKSDVWQGTLSLMVLKTLETMGPLHGYGIARRIEQTSGDVLSINYGTLYPALLKLAVALPPFDIPGFELKLHWHRRFDNEPRSRWFRDLLVQVFQEDRRSTMPPEPRGERKRTKTGT